MENENFFQQLTDSTFDVEVQLNDKVHKVKCRELPFGTFTTLITSVATSAREDMAGIRRDLAELVSSPGTPGTLGRRLSPETIAGFIQQGSSAFVAVLSDSPELFNDALRSVVVDSTVEGIGKMPLTCVITILSDVADRIDADLIADKLYKVFSKAAQISTRIREKREQAVSPQIPQETQEKQEEEED